ncbi:MAG: P1 family peptidase [Gemmatimonadetes bacterium]|nr:P1 family peptidase [Gemmatimonadota bacterium]
MAPLRTRFPSARLERSWSGVVLLALALPGCAEGQRAGASNTITDVPGVQVGHETRSGDGWQTGTTVVLVPQGATAAVDVQGGAPGTRETDLLEPGGLVTQAHAIVLSGGSAYGLATADGVMRWLEERGHGFPVGEGVVPIVPAAILFDLGRGGDFAKRPDAEFGYRAADAATDGPVAMGRVGAGTGARVGLGSASTTLPGGWTIGAVVGANPAGSPIDPTTCLPYGLFLEVDDEFGLTPPEQCPSAGEGGGASGAARETFNTTIAVLATDAPLDQTQARRMAQVANSGLARSIRPVHNLQDGDAVFAIATSAPDALSTADLQTIYAAAADVLGRAIVHAVLAEGSYCERYPGVCRER